MGKRNWEPLLFTVAAALVGLWVAHRALLVPFYRLRYKAGSWEYAWDIVSAAPGHWAAAILVRALFGLSLIWIVLLGRRLGVAIGYLTLAGAAFAIVLVDFILFVGFRLG